MARGPALDGARLSLTGWLAARPARSRRLTGRARARAPRLDEERREPSSESRAAQDERERGPRVAQLRRESHARPVWMRLAAPPAPRAWPAGARRRRAARLR